MNVVTVRQAQAVFDVAEMASTIKGTLTAAVGTAENPTSRYPRMKQGVMVNKKHSRTMTNQQ